MRRVIGWSWTVVWLGCLTVSASQLPPDVPVDKYLLQATVLNEEKNHKGALEAMDRIVALQRKHNLTLPEDFPFRYAKTALAAGSVQAAIESVNRYLSAAGREGKHYREALELLVGAERKLQELVPDPVAPTHVKPDLEPQPQAVAPSSARVQTTNAVQPAVDCRKWNTKKFFRKATVEDVTACINAGANIDARSGAWSDCSKCTALHRAALFNENAKIVQVLIDAGAQVNARDGGMGDCINCTPLHFAAMRNENPEVVRVLLENRADPNVRDDGWERTALHWASRNSTNPVIIRMLLVAGAELNARDEWKHTPLHLAALRNENPAVVETLLAAGADQMAENKKGKTPLQVASKRNRKVLRDAWASLTDRQKAAYQARVRRKRASAGPSLLDVAVGIAGGAAIAAAGEGSEEAVEAGTIFAEGVISGQSPVGSSGDGYSSTPTSPEESSIGFGEALRNLENSCGERHRSGFSEQDNGRFYCLDAFARHCALKQGHNQQQLDALRHDFEVLRSQGLESRCPYFSVFGVTYPTANEKEAIDRADKEAREARQEEQRRREEQKEKARQAAQAMKRKRLIEENNARVLASDCDCIAIDEKNGELTCLDGFVNMSCDIKRK